MTRVAVAIAVAMFPLALSAQWPDYPTPGAPKRRTMKPKLDGPAPRTADGHLDLSGVWENVRGNIGRPPRGFPAADMPASPPPPPPSNGPPRQPSLI